MLRLCRKENRASGNLIRFGTWKKKKGKKKKTAGKSFNFIRFEPAAVFIMYEQIVTSEVSTYVRVLRGNHEPSNVNISSVNRFTAKIVEHSTHVHTA